VQHPGKLQPRFMENLIYRTYHIIN
jgi:hypothetical protein